MDNYTMTKIVATLGPASNTKEKIKELHDAGVTIFRINSSHETPEVHQKTLDIIRQIEKEEKTLIPVLLDLQGPKIRIGNLENPIEIQKGEILKFRHQDKYENNIIPVDYEGIARDVSKGEKILIDDGKIQLEVTEVNGDIISAKVLTEGLLKQRKGINIPGSTGSINVLTERDKIFIDFAVKNDIDYIGLSFVRTPDDVAQLRQILHDKNSNIKIISKIEKPQAVYNIDKIIELSDGIMVARGDLGIEISTEKVPIVQKTIIKKANNKRKAVIVATQMLESMIENPIPTRAEASDVANAILDGTDAIMLSGETAAGKYPVEAVKMMRLIADNTENSQFLHKNCFPQKMINENNTQAMAIGMAISDMIRKVPNIKAIVALTGSGFTPVFLSGSKPSVPILACCPDLDICRAIKIYRAVFPVNFKFERKIDRSSLDKVDRFLTKKLGLKSKDTVIITGSVPNVLVGGTNFIKIHTINENS